MAKISMAAIKQVREATGAGILDTKKALEKAEGNMDKAIDILREKGAARAAKRSGREATEGVIKMYSHPGGRIGVMIEVNCETDFVARNDTFVQLAHDLALQVAAMSPQYVNKEDVNTEELDREIAVLRSQALAEGKPEKIVEKIVQGRLNKYYQEVCLMEQSFVKEEKKSVKQLITESIQATGENIIVRRFARYELGEEL